MMGLPIDLQNIVQSMLPGRERIEMWMAQNKLTRRGSPDVVMTELLRRYITHTEVLDPSLHVENTGYGHTRWGRVGRARHGSSPFQTIG